MTTDSRDVEYTRRALALAARGLGRTSPNPAVGAVVVAGGEVVGAPATSASVPQEARVIESNSEYAILEVICGCGNKMHIQCNYGDMTK